jgi:hypothetical protein
VFKSRIDRSAVLRLALVVVLLLLAILMLWHLFGMDHRGGMGALSTCLFLLVAGLLLAAPERAWRVRPQAVLRPHEPWPAPVEAVSRPPPAEGPLEGTVLIR